MTHDRPVTPRPHRTWRKPVLRALLALLALLLLAGGLAWKKAEHIVLGAEAYVFGYPLVMMDLTRDNSVRAIGPENRLRRVREFPGADFREVVRPNVDTLYTTGFIDLHAGPWVLDMPAQDQRYEVMALLDGWTDVFAAPGTRTHGHQGGRYLLVGPQWQGEVPAGMTVLRSSTRMAWLIGRTHTRSVADYPVVHALQDRLQWVSLADWQAGLRQAPALDWKPGGVQAPPIERMKHLNTTLFFERLMALMQDNPARPADGPMLMKMARIGLTPGQHPDWSWLDRMAVSLGRTLADRRIAQELAKPRDLVQGWQTPPDLLGRYGTSYNIRAVVAMIGLGANWPDDAIYPQTRVDGQGQPLSGQHRYRLHFAAGQWPPVKAFWSITVYGSDDFLQKTSRHAIGSSDALTPNADGSLDVWIGAEAPVRASERSNWLPVLSGQNFTLTARLYWPEPSALQGTWHLPAVERLD